MNRLVRRTSAQTARMHELVARFNRLFPVGTQVILRKDSGEVLTRVEHPAEILMGHSPIGWFSGVSGGYSIDDNRVRPACRCGVCHSPLPCPLVENFPSVSLLR